MNCRNLLNLFLLTIGGLFSAHANAFLNCGPGAPTIRASVLPYSILPSVTNQSVGVDDDDTIRSTVLTELAGAYRATHSGSLMTGAVFKMVYKNGSRECGRIVNPFASLGAVPVEGSQKASAGPGEVESTSQYIAAFQRNKPISGFYTVCYDYYSNGELTEQECTVHMW